MAGIQLDFAGDAPVTPGDGRPRELGRILDKDDNAYFKEVYVLDTEGARRAVGPRLTLTSFTTASPTATQKEGTILLGDVTDFIFPAATAGTDDGKRLLIVSTTASAKLIAPGTFNSLMDFGTTTSSPAQHSEAEMKGVGAMIEFVAAGGKWWALAGTQDADNTDSVYVRFL